MKFFKSTTERKETIKDAQIRSKMRILMDKAQKALKMWAKTPPKLLISRKGCSLCCLILNGMNPGQIVDYFIDYEEHQLI